MINGTEARATPKPASAAAREACPTCGRHALPFRCTRRPESGGDEIPAIHARPSAGSMPEIQAGLPGVDGPEVAWAIGETSDQRNGSARHAETR